MPSPSQTDVALLLAFRRAVRAKIRRDIEEEKALAEALRAAIVPVVRKAVGEARAQGLCTRAWLFGSFAWGVPGERSDVDLLVEGVDVDEVASLVGRASQRMVHAIELDRAPATLRERVLLDGTLL